MEDFSQDSKESKLVENKLILLYLIDKMEIPLSNTQISQFALGENIMNYFMLQECLADMVKKNYLEATSDNNATRYMLLEQGFQTLELFEKHIPAHLRNKMNKYVLENRKSIKKDYETTANYFKDISTGDFTVKCGIYEDDNMLMEINVSVVSRDHAKLICNNWKTNLNTLYGDILSKLITKPEKSEET